MPALALASFALAILVIGCAEKPAREPVPRASPSAFLQGDVSPAESSLSLQREGRPQESSLSLQGEGRGEGEPPPAPREFRAAWIATVANIDWPSRKGLTSAEQRAEMIAMLERASALKLNALILQVRPSADAIYPSRLEPWTEYLSGEQGKAPDYDPLQVWIEEAHRRGIEIHAWFNPYRARHNKAQSREAPGHIAVKRPDIVKSYGGYLWMDPGEPAAAQYTLDVILDVVRRYDIDGVHIDDYFYPYPVQVPEGSGNELDFPDEPSWRSHVASGGTLARADWRRQNVDRLIERINTAVHREKRWVRFGVSPFGIPRPDRRPPGIAGFSQYDKLYANVELWLERCWMDYIVPQVYWPIEQEAQAFPVLLDYWNRTNTCPRHVYAGLFTSRIDSTPKSWPVAEIVKQVGITRSRKASSGHVHFSMVALSENRAGISDALATTHYRSPALIPASPWIDAVSPEAPQVAARLSTTRPGGIDLQFTAMGEKLTARFAVWSREGGQWRFTVVPALTPALSPQQFSLSLQGEGRGEGAIDRIVVSAVDRLGNESRRVDVPVPFSMSAVEQAIVPVARWGGTPADPARARRHAVSRITLHHAGVAFPRERDPQEYLRSLQKWSREEKRWVDIPYHYVIDLGGRIYEGRDIAYAGDTNTEYEPAGHALVEVVGNFEETQPSPAQLDAVVRVMSWLARKHGLSETAIAGHRDYATTDCPGRNLYRYLENGWIRQRVRENLASHRP